MQDHAPVGQQTVVAEPRWVWVGVWLGFPAIGAAAGLALTPVSQWVVDLPWGFMRGPFLLVDHYAGTPLTIGAVAAGILAGLVLAGMGAAERLTVVVSDSRVTLCRSGAERHLDRAAVAAAFKDGKDLVLHGRATEELVREKTDLSSDQLAAAFRAHGYGWHAGGDPYAAQLRLWVPDATGLPDGANAVLAARSLALSRKQRDDAAALRVELSKLGVVVQDDGHLQFWRLTTGT